MNMLRWVGVTVFTAFLGMAGFTAVEWLHSNKADVEAEKVRTEADRVQIQNLNAIVNSLTSSIKPGTVVVNQNPNNQANPPGIPAPPGQVAQ